MIHHEMKRLSLWWLSESSDQGPLSFRTFYVNLDCLSAISHLACYQISWSPMSLLTQCFADLQVNYLFFFYTAKTSVNGLPTTMLSLKCLFNRHYSNRNSLHESIPASFLTAPAFFISNIYLLHNGNLNICWMNAKKLQIGGFTYVFLFLLTCSI